MNAAAAGLQFGALHARHHDYAAATTLCRDLALGGVDFDGAASGMQVNFGGHIAHIDGAATGFGVNGAADILEMNIAATAFRAYSPRHSGCGDISSLGFDLHFLHLTRDIDGEFPGKSMGSAAFPIGYDPRRVSMDISADLVVFKFVARFAFRPTIRMITNHVIDALLRTAAYLHRPDIHFYSQILDRG